MKTTCKKCGGVTADDDFNFRDAICHCGMVLVNGKWEVQE